MPETTVEQTAEAEIVILREGPVVRVTISFPGETAAMITFKGLHRARKDGSLFRLIESKAYGGGAELVQAPPTFLGVSYRLLAFMAGGVVLGAGVKAVMEWLGIIAWLTGGAG